MLQSFLAGTVPNSHVATMKAEVGRSTLEVGVEAEDMYWVLLSWFSR